MSEFGCKSPHFFHYEDANGKTSWVEMTVFDFISILIIFVLAAVLPFVCWEETRIRDLSAENAQKWHDHDCMGEFSWAANDISAPPGTRAVVTYKLSEEDKLYVLRFQQMKHIGYTTNYFVTVDGSNAGAAELSERQVKALKTLEKFKRK